MDDDKAGVWTTPLSDTKKRSREVFEHKSQQDIGENIFGFSPVL
jgi:hypothetical protein